MTERPILFTGPMVRAILDGRKAQTRRVIKKANSYHDGSPWPRSRPPSEHDWEAAWVDPGPSPAGNPGPYLKLPYPPEDSVHRIYPRVQPGDTFWVKETFALDDSESGDAPRLVWRADISARYFDNLGDGESIVYLDEVPHYLPSNWKPERWRPSIFMPRWASRLTLKVTDVRVQRVQDIRWPDIRSEGVDCPEHDFAAGFCCSECPDLRDAFQRLWSSINAKRGYPWKSNPWVFAYTFEVLDGR